MRNLLPAVALLLLLAASCGEPLRQGCFVEGEGPYVFALDLSDTSAAYNLDFYTRIDARDVPASIPLYIRWTSPAGEEFRETVYLPLEGRGSIFSRQVYQPYRADLRPALPGEWTLTVAIPYRPDGLRGLGLVCNRIKEPWDTEN